jgi:hypothetical protein
MFGNYWTLAFFDFTRVRNIRIALIPSSGGYKIRQTPVTIQAAQNLTSTCRTPMFRLSPGDTLLLEKRRSNSQVAE